MEKNLKKRIVTGMILATAIIILIYAGPYGFGLLILLIQIGASVEYYRLMGTKRLAANLGLILGSVLMVSLLLILNGIASWQILWLNLPLVASIYIWQLYVPLKDPFQNLASVFMGIIFVTIPLCLFLALGFPSRGIYSTNLIISIFVITWSADTGAYFFGKYFGQYPLFKRLSPRKTWEGALGAVFCSLIAVLFLSQKTHWLNHLAWAGLAIIVSITGIYGDLLKSMLKRSACVKDSGNLLPGHGGVLDRFDSLLGCAPFALAYIELLN